MPLKVPRFTIRRLMVLIAISGGLLGAGITSTSWLKKSRHYRALATRQAASEANAQARLQRIIALQNSVETQIAIRDEERTAEVSHLMSTAKSNLIEEVRLEKLKVARESALTQSYNRIARYPWLPDRHDATESK